MSEILYPEYIKSLENTKYPFVPTASLSNGTQYFLEGTILDAHIYAIEGTFRYFISRVDVSADKLTIFIGDNSARDRLSGSVAMPLTTGTVQLQDAAGRPSGILVSEPARLAILSSWGFGTHEFEINQTEFCITCQMPIPEQGVTGLQLPTGEIVNGKVWLMGSDGVVFSTEVTTDKNNNVIEVIRADIVGDPLYLQKLCGSDDLFVPVNPIRTIRVVNGTTTYDCQPDDAGNFNIQMNDNLVQDAALRVRTTPVGIVITVEGTTS